MSRSIRSLILSVCLAVSGAGFAQAQQAGPKGALPAQGLKIYNIDRGAAQPAGMKGARPRSMVATPDGGVIVMTGKRLIKYDKDLNVVKQVRVDAGCGCGKGCDCPRLKMAVRSVTVLRGPRGVNVPGEPVRTKAVGHP